MRAMFGPKVAWKQQYDTLSCVIKVKCDFLPTGGDDAATKTDQSEPFVLVLSFLTGHVPVSRFKAPSYSVIILSGQ